MPRPTDFTRTRAGTGDPIDNVLLRELLDVTKGQAKSVSASLSAIHKELKEIARKASSGGGRRREEIFRGEDFGAPPGGGTGRRRSTRDDPCSCATEFRELTRAVDGIRALFARGGAFRGAAPGGALGADADMLMAAAAAAAGRASAGATGTGGRGRTPRGDPAYWGDWKKEQEAYKRRKEVFPGLLAGTHSLKDAFNEAANSVKTGLVKPFKNLGPTFFGQLERIGIRFATLGEVIKEITDRFSEYNKDVMGTGLYRLDQYLLDDFERAARWDFQSESYRNTAQFIRRNISDTQLSPLQTTGMTPEQLGDFLWRARSSDQLTTNIYGRQTFQGFEDLLAMQLDVTKKLGITDDQRFTLTLKNSNDMLEYMRLTAAATGKTVDELVKAAKKTEEDVTTEQAAGLLGQEEGQKYANWAAAYSQLGGPQAEFVKRMNQAIWAGSLPTYLGIGNNGAINALTGGAVQGEYGSLMQILHDVVSGKKTPEQITNEALAAQRARGQSVANTLGNGANRAQLGGIYGIYGQDMGRTIAEMVLGRSVRQLTPEQIAAAKRNDPSTVVLNEIRDYLSQWGTLLFDVVASLVALGGIVVPSWITARATSLMAARGIGGALPGPASAAREEGAVAAGGTGVLARLGSKLGAFAKFGGIPIVGGLISGGANYLMGGGLGSSIGMGLGTALGGAVGLLGGPLGAILGSTIGGAVGQWAGGYFDTPAGADDKSSTTPSTAAAQFQQKSDAILKQTMQWQDDTLRLLTSILMELQEQTDSIDDIAEATSKSADHLADIKSRRQGFQQSRVDDHEKQFQMNRPNTAGAWLPATP